MTDFGHLADDASNATLRFEIMLPLAMALDGVETDGGWFENLMWQLEDVDNPIYDELPCLKVFAGGEDLPDPDDVLGVLQDESLPGFLAQLAHPVMTVWPNGSKSYSWGHYNTRWFYAPTVEELVAKGLAWAEELDAGNKVKTASA